VGNILDSLGQLVIQYPTWSHFIIGGAVLIQGELAILLSVYLVINKSLSWGDFVAATLGTLVVAETLVFLIGRALRNTRFGWRFYKKRKSNKKIQGYTYYLRTNLMKLLIIAKFLVGVNFIVLLLAGWSRTKLAHFLRAYLPSVILWFVSMTAVAYFFNSGLNYLKTEKIFHNAEIGIIIIFVLIFAGENLMRRIIKKTGRLEEKAEMFGQFVETELGEETAGEKNAASNKVNSDLL
jgi:membrane protein DedA with SNARE-associated domain